MKGAFKNMYVNSWSKKFSPLVLCIYLLLNTNVAESGSILAASTADFHLDLDSSLAVRENVPIAVEPIPKSYKNLTWISTLLSKKLSNFRPKSKTNQLCNQQSDLYERSLENLTLWAVQMREASAGSTPGMLVGQRFHMGHFDECISIQNPSVSGRYCLVNIKFAPASEFYSDFYIGESDGPPYSSAWDMFKKPKNLLQMEKNNIWWGICVPAACTRRDVEESLSKSFDALEKHGISLNFSMDDHLCQSGIDNEPLPPATKMAIYIIVFLTATCILATFYHLSIWNTQNLTERDGLVHTIMISFSMSTSFDMLKNKAGKINMNVLDALKVVSTILVLAVHRSVSLLASMVFNPSFFESELKDDRVPFLPLLGVEIFFMISGFLMYLTCYSPLKKHGIKIMPFLMFSRWLRLMPSYLTFIAFYALLFPYMGNGPGWKYMTQIVEGCEDQWWKNILGVQNLFWSSDDFKKALCATHTWYIACDLQLFPVGLLLVYMFSRNHSLGLKFGLMALAVALMIPFSIIYFNNYNAIITADRSYPDGPNMDYFLKIYLQSYTRAGPYIISIISAFLLSKIRESKWILPISLRWLILLAAIGVGAGSQFYGYVFYDATREYNPLENALFGALHRSLWSFLICAFIVIQIAWGFGESVDKLLTHQMYAALSRLSYLVYLFHPIWLLLTVASFRTPTFLSVWHIIWMLAGDIVVIYGAALWLYCIVEAPATHLISALLKFIMRLWLSEKEQVLKKAE